MRFMMIVIPKGYETAAADAVPSAEAVAKMMEYNKSLQKAGVLLGLDGLLPLRPERVFPSQAARPTVTDGPFAEAKEAYRGLLDHSGALAGRSDRMGQTGADGEQRNHRSAPDP